MGILETLSQALSGGNIAALPLALVGGVIAGVNPCCLALYPAAAGACCGTTQQQTLTRHSRNQKGAQEQKVGAFIKRPSKAHGYWLSRIPQKIFCANCAEFQWRGSKAPAWECHCLRARNRCFRRTARSPPILAGWQWWQRRSAMPSRCCRFLWGSIVWDGFGCQRWLRKPSGQA